MFNFLTWLKENLRKNLSPQGLFVSRGVENSSILHQWALDAGLKNVEPAEKMHVTVVYSRKPVAIALDKRTLTIWPYMQNMKLQYLGEEKAAVLTFIDARLSWRWTQAIQAGASWDWPGYSPHITVAYGDQDRELQSISIPEFLIILGAEVAAPLEESMI